MSFQVIGNLATVVLRQSWSWDEVRPVYLPEPLVRLLEAVAEAQGSIETEMIPGGPVPGNVQHAAAAGVAFHIAATAVNLVVRHPVRGSLEKLREVFEAAEADWFFSLLQTTLTSFGVTVNGEAVAPAPRPGAN